MMNTETRRRRYTATPELRSTIRRQGRLLTWMADQIGVSQGHFTRILDSERTVSADDARLLTTILGADFSALWNVSTDKRFAPSRSEEAA